MRKTKTTQIFKCDRCGTSEERNINKNTGILISFKKTHDMIYGNNTTGEYHLCQKCTSDFNNFMKEEDD